MGKKISCVSWRLQQASLLGLSSCGLIQERAALHELALSVRRLHPDIDVQGRLQAAVESVSKHSGIPECFAEETYGDSLFLAGRRIGQQTPYGQPPDPGVREQECQAFVRPVLELMEAVWLAVRDAVGSDERRDRLLRSLEFGRVVAEGVFTPEVHRHLFRTSDDPEVCPSDYLGNHRVAPGELPPAQGWEKEVRWRWAEFEFGEELPGPFVPGGASGFVKAVDSLFEECARRHVSSVVGTARGGILRDGPSEANAFDTTILVPVVETVEGPATAELIHPEAKPGCSAPETDTLTPSESTSGGFLDLSLDRDRRIVTRAGVDQVQFGGSQIAFGLLAKMVEAGGLPLAPEAFDGVWTSSGASPNRGTLQSAMHNLKRRIKRLGLEIPHCNSRGGYVLRSVQDSGAARR